LLTEVQALRQELANEKKMRTELQLKFERDLVEAKDRMKEECEMQVNKMRTVAAYNPGSFSNRIANLRQGSGSGAGSGSASRGVSVGTPETVTVFGNGGNARMHQGSLPVPPR